MSTTGALTNGVKPTSAMSGAFGGFGTPPASIGNVQIKKSSGGGTPDIWPAQLYAAAQAEKSNPQRQARADWR